MDNRFLLYTPMGCIKCGRPLTGKVCDCNTEFKKLVVMWPCKCGKTYIAKLIKQQQDANRHTI